MPVGPQPAYPFPERIEGLAPTLAISISGVPSTPYDAGTSLARTLGGGVLTVEGEQQPRCSRARTPA
ncbi:hypothetical protein I4I73_32500 [Pseudonocardia sp. KRD-184]|uniref:Uncharacterized protein n=1 Tax=Pseudonocardia oceani TaxID=2792013 RepID=A0ABS6U3F5_9PSEU|nr:alpha/beta hydrolase [Pseudonocardia oceani]MBW0094372.1 hypothetical protein [Pseudonocardia oceani]MBW0100707.1 hypothetical protein [Pseudonocardia oceani]MBW0113521.1 hypothetical protein [Pseudonocardia oceani]MBW0124770.1 hypothetical protein [Pseudonocardia oceani]MBW0126745.1 hypothetical protein [Pseudonocardia oceani]